MPVPWRAWELQDSLHAVAADPVTCQCHGAAWELQDSLLHWPWALTCTPSLGIQGLGGSSCAPTVPGASQQVRSLWWPPQCSGHCQGSGAAPKFHTSPAVPSQDPHPGSHHSLQTAPVENQNCREKSGSRRQWRLICDLHCVGSP